MRFKGNVVTENEKTQPASRGSGHNQHRCESFGVAPTLARLFRPSLEPRRGRGGEHSAVSVSQTTIVVVVLYAGGQSGGQVDLKDLSALLKQMISGLAPPVCSLTSKHGRMQGEDQRQQVTCEWGESQILRFFKSVFYRPLA